MSYIASLILKLFGWNIINIKPRGTKKAVIIMAPHTSNLDFILGRLAFFKYRMTPHIMIKKESFTFLMGPVLRLLGGIPVDRGHSQNTVKKITTHFEHADDFYLLITPEGSRKLVKNWKKGFYFIALTAKVPILFGFLDYKKKEGGVGKMIWPSGNYEEDMKIIEDFYRDKTARYPEKFSLTPSSPRR